MPVLDTGAVHEVLACAADRAAALAFALCNARPGPSGQVVLARMEKRRRGRTVLAGDGLAGLGLDPARLTLIEVEDEQDLLRAGLEACRCPGVGLVLLEAGGRLSGYDLTASRRLALAVERSGACVVLVRHDAEARPSAARTRWRISSAPSTPLEAHAPGWPVLEAELLRWRGGMAGRRWRLEWDADHGQYRDTTSLSPLPGAVGPLSGVRTHPDDGQDSRRAA
jgi:protein ImuA